MAEPLHGGCLCGAVRYTLGGSVRFNAYACHCTDCQTRSGSAFGIQLGGMIADLMVSGDLVEGHHMQPSGARATIVACAKCLTRIYTTNDQRLGFLNLRAGTLDNSRDLIPGFHLWVSTKQSWIVIPDDVPSLDTQPASPQEWLTCSRRVLLDCSLVSCLSLDPLHIVVA